MNTPGRNWGRGVSAWAVVSGREIGFPESMSGKSPSAPAGSRQYLSGMGLNIMMSVLQQGAFKSPGLVVSFQEVTVTSREGTLTLSVAPSVPLTYIAHQVQFSRSVVSNSSRLHGLQHARLPCPSPAPGVCSNSCSSSWWCHPTISSSVVPFSSCLQWLVYQN